LVADNNGCYDTTYTTIVITDAGIENLNFTAELYPNPFTSYITMGFNMPESGKELTIEAYNSIGQKLQQIYTGNSVSGKFVYTWNAPANLAPGVYFIKVNYDGKQLVKQVIKQ